MAFPPPPLVPPLPAVAHSKAHAPYYPATSIPVIAPNLRRAQLLLLFLTAASLSTISPLPLFLDCIPLPPKHIISPPPSVATSLIFPPPRPLKNQNLFRTFAYPCFPFVTVECLRLPVTLFFILYASSKRRSHATSYLFSLFLGESDSFLSLSLLPQAFGFLHFSLACLLDSFFGREPSSPYLSDPLWDSSVFVVPYPFPAFLLGFFFQIPLRWRTCLHGICFCTFCER